MRTNSCLIDWLRFSIPNISLKKAAEDLLGIPIEEFGSEGKSSPFPTYDFCYCFANIELHSSKLYSNILVNLSGTACRQYEEYMSQATGWHWQSFISTILKAEANPSRIDLALDIFDGSSPGVQKLQDYVKRGQLSTKANTFKEINSGRILDGQLKGFTLYVGSSPQLLRIYDKKQEVRDNTSEIVNVNQWVRWELELGDRKAIQVCNLISNGIPLNYVIKGILASHYSFKTQPKNKKDFHNKARWNNMRWWDKFIEGILAIPLRIIKEKATMKAKKSGLKNLRRNPVLWFMNLTNKPLDKHMQMPI